MKITAQNLVKVYGDRSVVNDISFEIETNLKSGNRGKYTSKFFATFIIATSSMFLSLLILVTILAIKVINIPISKNIFLIIFYP